MGGSGNQACVHQPRPMVHRRDSGGQNELGYLPEICPAFGLRRSLNTPGVWHLLRCSSTAPADDEKIDNAPFSATPLSAARRSSRRAWRRAPGCAACVTFADAVGCRRSDRLSVDRGAGVWAPITLAVRCRASRSSVHGPALFPPCPAAASGRERPRVLGRSAPAQRAAGQNNVAVCFPCFPDRPSNPLRE